MTVTAVSGAAGVGPVAAQGPGDAPRAVGSRRAWLADHWERRKWALLAMVVFVAVSLAVTFPWGPVVRHKSEWVVPGDIWSTFRNAHQVGWGASARSTTPPTDS
jgi:hypothetical protein